MKHPYLLYACLLLSIAAHAQKQLWGMAVAKGATKGAIFKTDSAGNNYTDVYTFNDPANGIDPYGSLMQATDGKLYGMTSAGGVNNFGVLFQVDPATGVYTKKHDFDSVNGKTPYGSLVQAANGKLYGMTHSGGMYTLPKGMGVLFEYDPATNTFTKKVEFQTHNIAWPYGTLTKGSDGMLYGLASAGGADATGILFQYDILTATTAHIGSFIAGPMWFGYAPRGAVVQVADGSYYGLSRHGGAGAAGGGAIFRYDPAGPILDKVNVAYNLSELAPDSLNGYELMGSLVYATDGKLYGMAQNGGTNGAGAIFSYDPVIDTFIKRHDFNGATEGYAPYGSLMQASDGWLYGLTTSEGGQARLFRFNITTNTLQVKADVTGTPCYTTLIETTILPTGITELRADDVVKIYPTPSADIINIDLPNGYTCSHVAITGIAGNVVQQYSGNIQTIDVSGLPEGVYILNVSANGKMLRGTFVRQ